MSRTIRCLVSGAQSVKVLEKRLGSFQENIVTYAVLPAERQTETCSESEPLPGRMKAHCPRRGATPHRSNTARFEAQVAASLTLYE
ncbi:uncharacterized protein ANIA_11374 [Aspergillus nidulans FGSC A4]|uniref:Uncharacterized protein n=1 Tax=Emericella nidulans (strain FGSC A4 / ATCC 38163 / CBS 112.46 / NRRL 194 / M139) TaxID=227321 RepID=C8VJ19_EMENI|nr:hypothetical protein [Aspergillus nidulans FGSC A4]CBF83671.1 TPA: hypothetical protein ANIA_11374 [Aspergillus nidulans FGSC A4]